MKGIQRLTLSVCLIASSAVIAPAQSNSAGSVNFVMGTSSAFNKYTDSPAAALVSWMTSSFWRLETTSPYFDSRLSWFPNAWAYNDLYGVWTGDSVVQQHPDWVLRDQYGNWLYIPFACNGSSCSQWALDPGNPDVRNWWINKVKAQMSKGYKGLWIDDVNLVWRVSNGSGDTVVPYDPRTGQQMTLSAWQGYVTGFVKAVRSAITDKEIIHNSLWFAGGTDYANNTYITQQIQAADYINLERGIDDTGLTGGTGQWSVNAFLGFIDHVHSLGRHVVFDEYAYNGDYQTAGYLLINDGKDGLDNRSVSPTNWWFGYDVKLGNAKGARYTWNGLLRRDFDNGFVLLNLPGSSQVKVSLGGTYLRDDGSWVSSVTLNASQGAVLQGENATQSGGMVPNGTYKLQNVASSLLLDDPKFTTTSGAQIIEWPANGGSNQDWVFAMQADGFYTIENGSSGLYLTSASSAGGALTQKTKSNDDSQLWWLKSNGSGYEILSKSSGLAIDDPNFSTTKGTGIIVYGANGGNNQLWSIK